MEQQKLPYVTIIIVLSIASILLCWCYGLLGLIPSVVALILAIISKKKYIENPENYSNYGSLQTGKVLAIIGLILNILIIAFFAWMISAVGWDVLQSGDEELIIEKIQDLLGQ